MNDEIEDREPLRVDSRSLVVLAGPSGSGKSTWAARWFEPAQTVATDDLRAVVGEHAADQRAGADAFELLDLIIERRLARGLLTVVDTLGMDANRHATWLEMAARHKRPTLFVTWDLEAKVTRARNRARPSAVPAKVLKAQLEKWADVAPALGSGFDRRIDLTGETESGPVVVVPTVFATAAPHEHRLETPLRFGLSVSSFAWSDDQTIAERLGEIAVEAEQAGFSSLWVMDHFIQIPQVGREWDPMLESHLTLGWLAARTSRIRLGTLVSGVSYRSIGHIAKLVSTLDVLSDGRAMCGLGAAWFEREHKAYGHRFPPLNERYDLLADALEALPLYWGPGSPSFDGRTFSTPEALCYPRPVQERIPILVGGSGERRTLRLVAEHADAANLFGDPATVRHKLDVLSEHCAAVERPIDEITVTHLSTALSAVDERALDARLRELQFGRISRDELARRVNAASVEGQIDRYTQLRDAGVQEAIVSLADVGSPGSVRDFAPVIDAFRV